MSVSIEPIQKIYCQKILPLVYDDSLSYYETICKFQSKLNEVIEAMDGLSLEVLTEANAYTDEKIAEQQAAIDEVVAEMEQLIADTREELQSIIDDTTATFNEKIALLDERYTNFTNIVEARLINFNSRLEALSDKIDNDIAGVNARTDLAIEQNNEYIFEQIGEQLFEDVKVRNMFTGQTVTIQQMFDFLGSMHVTDGIDYEELAEREKTVSEMIAYYADYTDFVLHANSIIV